MAKTILNNLYQYKGDILADIVLPNGMDGDTLKATIFRRCYQLEVIYPEWDIMKQFSDMWFQSHLGNFQKMWDAINLDFNIINDYSISRNYSETGNETGKKNENYEGSGTRDKTINNENRITTENLTSLSNDKIWKEDDDLTINKSESEKNGGTKSETVTRNTTDTTTENITTTGGNINQIAPYNASTFVNNVKDDSTIDSDKTTTVKGTGTIDTKDTIDNTKTLTAQNKEVTGKTGNETNTGKNTQTGTETGMENGSENVTYGDKHGNVIDSNLDKNKSGNMTESGYKESPLYKIEKQLEIARLNLYELIASMWEDNFCITVY